VKSSEAKPCFLQAKTPAKRNIPVAIRREVWLRDDGRCTYQSLNGRRCGSHGAIEFHHRIPWARHKEHTIDNIALRCRAHNQYEAELDFGTAHMAQFRKEVEAR
jgi:5-methylcytosine-specific restriction endonuclease McrA